MPPLAGAVDEVDWGGLMSTILTWLRTHWFRILIALIVLLATIIEWVAIPPIYPLNGVEAAGAVRQTNEKLIFAALPSTGVPIYETTPGVLKVFALSTTGTRSGPIAGANTVGYAAESDVNDAMSVSQDGAQHLSDERVATERAAMALNTASDKNVPHYLPNARMGRRPSHCSKV